MPSAFTQCWTLDNSLSFETVTISTNQAKKVITTTALRHLRCVLSLLSLPLCTRSPSHDTDHTITPCAKFALQSTWSHPQYTASAKITCKFCFAPMIIRLKVTNESRYRMRANQLNSPLLRLQKHHLYTCHLGGSHLQDILRAEVQEHDPLGTARPSLRPSTARRHCALFHLPPALC